MPLMFRQVCILAIRLHCLGSRLPFSGGPSLRPPGNGYVFVSHGYNRVSRTKLWHSTARPTLAA